MKKIAIVVTLLIVAAFVIYGGAFAQKDAAGKQKPVKAQEAVEPAEPAESTEAAKQGEKSIPYSEAYNSPGTGADRANADEDSE
ncbi:MAG: hypothetical protein PHF11_07670 [Candidatus Omnitrophica bacterium]|nr:hypothetical protein [Candidatus Omnitrophota bacterium]